MSDVLNDLNRVKFENFQSITSGHKCYFHLCVSIATSVLRYITSIATYHAFVIDQSETGYYVEYIMNKDRYNISTLQVALPEFFESKTAPFALLTTKIEFKVVPSQRRIATLGLE